MARYIDADAALKRFEEMHGNESELTAEQFKELGIEVETTRKNPFERVDGNEAYWFIKDSGIIDTYSDRGDSTDSQLYKTANYFNDQNFAIQVALHQLLYRKLLKFAYDNECEDTAEWDGRNQHWTITYDKKRSMLGTHCLCIFKTQGVYFSSEVSARVAIKDVVEPFMKEHPDFMW